MERQSLESRRARVDKMMAQATELAELMWRLQQKIGKEVAALEEEVRQEADRKRSKRSGMASSDREFLKQLGVKP